MINNNFYDLNPTGEERWPSLQFLPSDTRLQRRLHEDPDESAKRDIVRSEQRCLGRRGRQEDSSGQETAQGNPQSALRQRTTHPR